MLVSTTEKITIIIKRSKKFNNVVVITVNVFIVFFSLDFSRYLHDIFESLDQLDRNDSRDRNRKQQRSQCAIENKTKVTICRERMFQKTYLCFKKLPRSFKPKIRVFD